MMKMMSTSCGDNNNNRSSFIFEERKRERHKNMSLKNKRNFQMALKLFKNDTRTFPIEIEKKNELITRKANNIKKKKKTR